MKQAIAAFCRYLDSERNVSPHTLEAYRRDLEQFHRFLAAERGEEAGPAGVDHLLIRRYLAQLHREYEKSSIGRKLAALRALYIWLLRTGQVAKNPAELVSTPRREKKVLYH